MSRLPSLPTLRAFEAAARHRSFSRAGNELGLTHGAISHRIREMEDRLGERLFRRSGNMMEPTVAATRYLGSVRQALDLLRAAFDPVGRGALTLQIAVLPSFGSHWLAPRLRTFEDAYPDVAVTLDARLEVVPLGSGHADAAIRHGHGNWPDMRATRLIDERAFPVCSPEYGERLRISHPADLERCHLLRHSWLPWTAWFVAAGVAVPEPGDAGVYNDAGLLIDMAVAGNGVLLARDVLVDDAIRAGRLMRLFDISIPFPGGYWFVRPEAAGPRDDAITLFGAWLSATLNAGFPGKV